MDKKSIISSFFWKFSERIGAQIVNFIVTIVLARLLAPEEYGIVALITIFINIANVFIESGFGTALIQKKDADDLDFSSVFYFNIVTGIIIYVILFSCAPLIATFYNNEKLIAILRVLGIQVVVASLRSVQNAYVSKKMIFKKFFICTIIGTVISAFLGVALAYRGAGAWALVAQQLCNVFIDTLMLWIVVKWRPILKFSFLRLKGLFAFGWKLLCSSLIDTIYNEIYGLVIGKVYQPQALAFYNKGNQFPKLITTNVNGSIQSVMLPALSLQQDDKQKVKAMVRRSIITSAFFIFPMMTGLICIARPLVSLVLTDKWLECVPFLQMMCLVYVLYPIHTANLQAINAIGRSDIFLKLEIIKKIIITITLIISIRFGIYVMVGLTIVTSGISSIINAYPNKKLLNYSIIEQVKDILPSLILSIIMGLGISMLSGLELGNLAMIIAQVSLGGIIYLGLAYLLKLESLTYLVDIVRNRKKVGKELK